MVADFAAAAGNLPAEPNSFIGRERDLAELVAMLGRVRALTLCGPGGIGKTRLALRLAQALSPAYPDGVWIAELGEADLAGELPARAGAEGSSAGTGQPGPDRLVRVITSGLGIRQEADTPLADTLIEALRPRSMILILDTCEHLIQASAELVQKLLAGCRGLRVIATSREPLRIRGEVIWRVPPLGLPLSTATEDSPAQADEVAQYEAVRLFVERAAAVRPGFTLDQANAAAVAEVCRTLDGVPLAIELAAARVRALSVDQIAARLADRFELLALGDRTAPPRQQTLRATVQWSYELLTPAEKLLLSRLAVFHGWNLEMAERICSDAQLPKSDVLDVLTALIDKSLVSLDAEVSGNARYRLLDTVREIAAEHAVASGEMPRLRARHRDCTLEMAELIASRAFVRGEPSWPERVAMYHRARAEKPNINAALAWCVQNGDAEKGLRLCHSLAGSFLASGDVTEGAFWIDRLLAIAADVEPGLRSRALAVRGELAFELQDYRGAREHSLACLKLSQGVSDGDPATALRLLALTDLVAGRTEEALAQTEAAVAAARQMGDDWEEGVALAARAATIASQGDLGEAEVAFKQALDVLADNNGWGVASVLYGLGQVDKARDDLAGALGHYAAALAIYRQIDAWPEMARCLAGIGWAELARGDLAAARSAMTESMSMSLATGHRLAIGRGLRALAKIAATSGDIPLAVRLCGAALSVFEAIGTLPAASGHGGTSQLLATARSALGEDAVAALLAEGGELSPHQAASLLAGGTVPGQQGSGELEDGSPPGGVAAADLSAGNGAATVHQGGAGEPRNPAAQLTGREREVAALVAQGLSNRAIGQRLYISQTTAARHVANIFAKRGLRSRAQIVAWLAGQDPADEG
jgi:predicted ATPase/DNA-binding CsgD family transcriptional regulator